MSNLAFQKIRPYSNLKPLFFAYPAQFSYDRLYYGTRLEGRGKELDLDHLFKVICYKVSTILGYKE